MSDPVPERFGKYSVTGALARGATSRVYVGEDPFSGRACDRFALGQYGLCSLSNTVFVATRRQE
jgi:hypothetical protein